MRNSKDLAKDSVNTNISKLNGISKSFRSKLDSKRRFGSV